MKEVYIVLDGILPYFELEGCFETFEDALQFAAEYEAELDDWQKDIEQYKAEFKHPKDRVDKWESYSCTIFKGELK